jgi:hypothetical protein
VSGFRRASLAGNEHKRQPDHAPIPGPLDLDSFCNQAFTLTTQSMSVMAIFRQLCGGNPSSQIVSFALTSISLAPSIACSYFKNVPRILLKSNLERGIFSRRRAVGDSLQVRFDILKVEMVLCAFGPANTHVSMMRISISSSADWTER